MTMRDTEKLRDKVEVSLDSRQIFFLFFGGAVVACLVFVLGVMVGRRLESRERVMAKAETSAAVDPLAALDELGADDQREALTFPSALTSEPGAKKKSAAEEAPPPKEVAKVAEPALAPKPALPALPAPPPLPVPTAKASPLPVAPALPVAKTLAAAKVPASIVPPPLAQPAAAPKRKTARFTLQLSSFQDRSEANSFITKLVTAGYKPYVVASEVEGRGVFYRVRIGEYEAHGDALAAKSDFERRQHIIAYVTRL
jgi:cell division septation protein DedD